jgi:hypothetical protein
VNVQLPLEWYGAVLQDLRRALGFQAQAFVFSDGREEELADLLALPKITLRRGGQAITDMLMLARARCMIASGSTFSMWASFLGQVPCVWYPGQRRQLLVSQDGNGTMEPEAEGGHGFPDEFVEAVRGRWHNRA